MSVQVDELLSLCRK